MVGRPIRVHYLCGIWTCTRILVPPVVDEDPKAARCARHAGRTFPCPRCWGQRFPLVKRCFTCDGTGWVVATVAVAYLYQWAESKAQLRRLLGSLARCHDERDLLLGLDYEAAEIQREIDEDAAK